MGCHVRILRIHGALAPVECQSTGFRFVDEAGVRSLAQHTLSAMSRTVRRLTPPRIPCIRVAARL